jgi:hypothetical protein
MVDMGLLDIAFDVRAECNSGERVPGEQLEKSNFLNYIHLSISAAFLLITS